MKTITKEINLYTVDELSKDAFKKAHDKFVATNEYHFLSDFLNERLHELLEEKNITDRNDTSKPGTKPTQVRYSLSYSQGDGCMFEGEFAFEYNGLAFVAVVNHSGQYTHERSTSIEIFKLDIDEDRGEIPSSIDYTELEKYFEETLYIPICKDLERYGYDFIEQEDSEENYKEYCESNDITFLVDGTVFVE